MHFHFLMEICCISFIFYKYKKKKTSEQDNYIEWPRQSRGQFSPLQWKLHKAASKRGKKRLPIFWIHLFEPFVCQCVSCRTPEELRLTFSFPHRVSFSCRCWCEVTAAPQLQTPLNKSHSYLLCNTGDDTLFFFFAVTCLVLPFIPTPASLQCWQTTPSYMSESCLASCAVRRINSSHLLRVFFFLVISKQIMSLVWTP